jgi:hypothetical protein
MIRKLWIYPPLAIGRLGNSDTPLEAFFWGPNDDTPAGTGKTTILPAETLTIADDGTVSSFVPETIRFKDEVGFRPVCPLFELHAEWDGSGGPEHGPLTPAVLARFGLDARCLRWTVEVANLKPYFMTRDWQTRIHARVEFRGDDVGPRTLDGVAPSGAPNPLVPLGRSIPLGVVRLTRPNQQFPEFRLRFTPARGKFYGPPNLLQRWPVQLPPEQLFLNAASSWCFWKPSPDDMRGVPGGQYAQDTAQVSLGLVDDVCDGLVTCAIDGVSVGPAHARITVAPPDYAPDRRHFVSLADGLKDRVDRADVYDSRYLDDADLTSREVRDLLERVWETMGLINLDVFNDRVDVKENPAIALANGIPYKPTDHYAFTPPVPTDDEPLPLTALGRRYHRRFVAIEVFCDMLRKHPDLLDEWVRSPLTSDLFFDRKMPALMRSSSGDPLHLTRRQYDLLVRWARKLAGPQEGQS